MVVFVPCKNEADSIENEAARVLTTFPPPIITLWELSVAMETRVMIRSGRKPKAACSPNPVMHQIKFDCDQPNGCGDILV